MVGAKPIDWDQLDKRKLCTFLPAASLTVRGAVFPFFLLKTRFHANLVPREQGLFPAMRALRQKHGFRALYQGFSVSVLTTPMGPVYFSILEGMRKHLRTLLGSGTAANAGAGAAASCVGQIVTVPVDVVVQRMQVCEKPTPASVVVRDLLATSGVRGLWRGLSVSLTMMIPSSSLTWTTYFGVTDALHARMSVEPPREEGAEESWSETLKQVGISSLGGATAGLVTGVALNPMDVIRTRLQVLDRAGSEGRPSVATFVRDLYQEQGLRGFTAGWRARVASLIPLLTCVMTGYDVVKRVCRKDPEELVLVSEASSLHI